MAAKIELYTATWCLACQEAKEFLDAEGIRYQRVEIDKDPQAAARLEAATGKQGIPTLVVDGEWVQAYEPGGGPFPRERILEVLRKTSGSVTPASFSTAGLPEPSIRVPLRMTVVCWF